MYGTKIKYEKFQFVLLERNGINSTKIINDETVGECCFVRNQNIAMPSDTSLIANNQNKSFGGITNRLGNSLFLELTPNHQNTVS